MIVTFFSSTSVKQKELTQISFSFNFNIFTDVPSVHLRCTYKIFFLSHFALLLCFTFFPTFVGVIPRWTVTGRVEGSLGRERGTAGFDEVSILGGVPGSGRWFSFTWGGWRGVASLSNVFIMSALLRRVSVALFERALGVGDSDPEG